MRGSYLCVLICYKILSLRNVQVLISLIEILEFSNNGGNLSSVMLYNSLVESLTSGLEK